MLREALDRLLLVFLRCLWSLELFLGCIISTTQERAKHTHEVLGRWLRGALLRHGRLRDLMAFLIDNFLGQAGDVRLISVRILSQKLVQPRLDLRASMLHHLGTLSRRLIGVAVNSDAPSLLNHGRT